MPKISTYETATPTPADKLIGTDAETGVTRNFAIADIVSLVEVESGAGVTDHGLLTGLADDDHAQYFNQTRGDARYSQLGHTHSDYVTDSELGTALEGKVDDTDPRLSDARNPTPHNHQIADVTGLQGALDGKAASSHTHTLDNLSDVTISSPSDGQVLKYSGGVWVNGADATSGGAGTDADTLDGNDSAYFLNRSNHTGTQTIASVSGLQTALDGKANSDHTQAWSTITSTPTTLAAYGITDAASDSELASHEADTTNVHGIADTSALVLTSDTRLTNSRTPSGGAGGVLSGTYPNPGFAVDMATQAELDAHTSNTSNPHSTTASQVGAEPALGNPSTNGYILSSTTGGVRSWIAAPSGSGGATVYVQTNEPVGATDGTLWVDTDDTATTATPTFASFLKWEL